ncbi:MAG: ribulose-phosphate 3-epimerase [Prolixibacteraceae bacterium]
MAELPIKIYQTIVNIMNSKIKIEASVACANFRNLEGEIREMELSGIDYLHIDIMDGMFVPNFCLDFSIMKTISEITDIPMECHLMIENPERYIEKAAQMGSKYISIHTEATHHVQRAMVQIRGLGVKSGIALNPATPISVLDYILEDLDMIVILTVNPGFAGQALIPGTIGKILEVRELLDRKGFSNIEIQVDGNVSMENIPKMVNAGATMLVGGTSSVFRKGHSIKESVTMMRSLY